MAFCGLKPQERINLPTHFLRAVVAQVRFPYLYEIEEPGEIVAAMQRALSEEYPHALPREEPVFAIMLGSVGQGQRQPRPVGPYRFKSSDDKWLVSLAPDYIALEATEYETFDEFSTRFDAILETAEEHLKPTAVERVGLRYLNQVPLASEGEWRQLFDSSLLGLTGEDSVADCLVQALSQVTVRVEDHYLTVRHGLAMQDDRPSEYTLDLDAFAGPVAAFDRKVIAAQLSALKSSCWSFFRGSITDEYLRRAGAIS